MHLISLLIDPAFHAIIVIICLMAVSVFAQTAPYACPSGQVVTQELANTGMSCSTLAYSQLSGLPTIPAAQVNSDWNAVTGLPQIFNKPNILTSCYDGITKRNNCFPISAQATVASGNAVYQLTADGTSTGTALCTNGLILNSFQPVALDSTLPYEYGTPVISNSNKTLTVPVNKSSGLLTILGLSVLGAPAAANGSIVNETGYCY